LNADPDLILFNGKITTLDRQKPQAEAIAVRDGRFQAVGDEREIMGLADARTRRIDLKGRRVIPGLIDSHMHVIRGGLNYNMELRWDGVRSLADAMAMLEAQVERTPAPQWVRVIGGFTEHQFAEQRLPTLEEINAVAPDTPVFLLHLYDRALLNRAALRAVGYTKDTPEFPGAEIVRAAGGEPTGLLLAKPNATILYATLAKGPKLPPDYQKNSTRHFMRELNRLGVTGVIDAGGGFQNYPDDYRIIEELHRDGELTIRIAYNLFTQKPKQRGADAAGRHDRARRCRVQGVRPADATRHAGLVAGRSLWRVSSAGNGCATQSRPHGRELRMRPRLHHSWPCPRVGRRSPGRGRQGVLGRARLLLLGVLVL
jgi:predicted amidohydrolase YtcJ